MAVARSREGEERSEWRLMLPCCGFLDAQGAAVLAIIDGLDDRFSYTRGFIVRGRRGTTNTQRRLGRSDLGTRQLIDERIRAIRPYLEHRPKAQAALIDTAEKVAKRIEMLPTADGGYGLCHGDIHPGNVMFDDDGAPTVFDFDCRGYGWRAYDLVTF